MSSISKPRLAPPPNLRPQAETSTTSSQQLRLERIFKNISQASSKPRNSPIHFDFRDLRWLCQKSILLFQKDPMLLRLESPITVCGDLHGQFYDLLKFIELGGHPPDTKYLFLGDYVDRGRNSIETFTYLLALKVSFPNSVFLIRGNHETKEISRLYGFYDECVQHYTSELWQIFSDVFEYLPLAAIVDNAIFCVHGGLSPDLEILDQIASLSRPFVLNETNQVISDLVWSDPSPSHLG